MANVITFPKLTAAERDKFDLVLASITRIERPSLVELLIDGKQLNSLPIVENVGKIANDAWRELHASEAMNYPDESPRKRQVGGSQTETVRAFCKKIVEAYREVKDEDYPLGCLKLTGGYDASVDFWRIG